ncbi:flagellar protein FlaG [Brevibacillus choshinensis]|uniref:flagellar protein FlaG n=1 Tax=Brevibacillus choshinensis TaxID=54911 RepID=UPI002E213948|nr:flagellar protein FlaG [Brevibacillus choshinensis]
MNISSVNPQGKTNQQVPELPLNNAGGQHGKQDKVPVVAEGANLLTREHIEKQLETLNKLVQTNTHLKFTLHEKLNEYFVQIVDNVTNEIVREVPSKKILDFTAKFQEMIGILVDEKR